VNSKGLSLVYVLLRAEQLKLHKLTHRSVHIQPRGLTNRGNWCYVNAVSFEVVLFRPKKILVLPANW